MYWSKKEGIITGDVYPRELELLANELIEVFKEKGFPRKLRIDMVPFDRVFILKGFGAWNSGKSDWIEKTIKKFLINKGMTGEIMGMVGRRDALTFHVMPRYFPTGPSDSEFEVS